MYRLTLPFSGIRFTLYAAGNGPGKQPVLYLTKTTHEVVR